MNLEICAFNIQSCIIAEAAGASRIELCVDPLQGGTTPSYGILQYVQERVSIPVFPMIRPRGGDFMYDTDELAIMIKDIIACRELGFPGIVIGILTTDGEIDTLRMARMVKLAYPMQVTCHKAFDKTPDASKALEALIDAGCTRVLTSGLCNTAVDGIATLKSLNAQAKGRIIIMPGGGVRSDNIVRLAAETGCREFHSSALMNKGMEYVADRDEVRKLVDGLFNVVSK